MSSYSTVVTNAKDLQEEFKNKISVFESLQIAAQIQLAEVIKDSFQTGFSEQPAFLEAIAISLGYKQLGGTTISEAILELASSKKK